MPRLHLAFSSDPTLGAEQVSADGSSFSVSLGPPLAIPPDARDIEIGVVQASIWNTSPNIAAAFGANTFTYTTTAAPAGTSTITIPDGLWDLASLGGYLSLQFQAAGRSSTLFEFGGAAATGQVAITAQYAGDSIDFTGPTAIWDILGFLPNIIAFATAGQTIFGSALAKFNRNSTIVLTTSLIYGLQFNRRARGVISIIPIDVAPGSLINYNPSQLIMIDAPELRGATISNIDFALRNQSYEAMPTFGETYAFVVVISYQL